MTAQRHGAGREIQAGGRRGGDTGELFDDLDYFLASARISRGICRF
jgi:hypothetical protein